MLPHSILRSILRPTALVAVVAFVFACDDAPTAPVEAGLAPSPTSQAVAVDQDADQHTAFQRSLMQQLAARQAQGLPVPRAEYTYEETTAGPPLLMAAGADEPPRTVVATTVVAFDHPSQAGLERWPDVIVEGTLPEGAEGHIAEGDYTDLIKQTIAERYPDAWSGVTYEDGPRTYTVTESVVLEPTGASDGLALLGVQGAPALVAADEILLGFTTTGPGLDYSVSFNLEICIIWLFDCWVEVDLIEFWAGFELDWNIATRLPMTMAVVRDEPVLEGMSFVPLTSATGQNWAGPAFEAVGLAAEDGNEFLFLFDFKAGVNLTVLEFIELVNFLVDVDIDSKASFTTPLGAALALPSLSDPDVWSTGLGSVAGIGFGVVLTPTAGSDRLTAAWTATDEASGSGLVEYESSGAEIDLGSVVALDGPGHATVTLSDLRYYFNQFYVDFGVSFTLTVLGWSPSWTIPVADFDLSSVMGGLHVGPHAGTVATLALSVPIENVAPTVVVSHQGAVMIHGVPTYLAAPGQALTFTGTAADPGQDDLTLRWDWDDGDPAPDVTTDYEVPYTVTESQTHAFADACVYQVALSAVDDDLAEGEDHVAVLVAGLGSGAARLEGYWQHQLGQQGKTELDEATLDCYLGIVAAMSAMFSEELDVSSIPAAHAILSMGGNGGDARAQFDRELLVLWLNFAHGAIGLDDLVDGDGDGVPETAFSEMVAAAEALRMSADTDAKALRRMTQRLHLVSVALVS